MKRNDWTVTEVTVRPANPVRDQCLYCEAKIGSQHKPKCYVRQRVVMVDVTLRIPMLEPEHWDAHSIEFHLTGNLCASSIIDRIAELTSDDECPCEYLLAARYVREATAKDFEVFPVMHRLLEESES